MQEVRHLVIELNKFNDYYFDNKYHCCFKKSDNSKIKISASKFVSTFTPVFEKEKIAERVAKKRGISVEEVLKEWDLEAEISKEKGNCVHEYIESKLNNKKKVLNNVDLKYQSTLKQVDKFCDIISNKLIPIKLEWLVASEKLNSFALIDCIFYNVKFNEFQIFDWKTNKKIANDNKFGNKMLHEFSNLDECELVKYSLQLSFEKAILSQELDIPFGKSYIVHFKEDDFDIIPSLDYSSQVLAILSDKERLKTLKIV